MICRISVILYCINKYSFAKYEEKAQSGVTVIDSSRPRKGYNYPAASGKIFLRVFYGMQITQGRIHVCPNWRQYEGFGLIV
jgi:hypothetical protein